ncbi:MAG: DUF368 domain-containing protein [Bacteroidales bacterium]|nr:DUF368 domain-containing protein [Bacteroidales bacterium]MBQ9711790.1 DUF368 domain-containing protein [Bacteroidales bacterium]
MNKFMNDIIVALKGFGMGAANVIPGVSGGTIALLTGIFTRLIDCLNALMEIDTWKTLFKGDLKGFWQKIDGRFLLALAVGVLVSVFSLAKLMEYVLHVHPVQTWGFFFGMIAASATVMLLDVKNWKWKDVCWAIFGVILGVVICTLSPTQTTDDLWFIFICGAIAICTMILPGVSGSFILLIFGKYDYIMGAVSSLNWPVLIVFAAGCVIGILAFSKFLHWLLEKYERQTMLVLVGFVIGSLVKVWPWNDRAAIAAGNVLSGSAPGEMHVSGAILWAFAGIFLVWLLEMLSSKKK